MLFQLKRIASLVLVLMVSTWCQAAPINDLIQKRLKMGEKTNRLIHEKSPYLLQHAFNPVEWYPWGEEAFAKAKAENKPIFLSVGYSTCHWCHVMEEESFENPKIAAILNRWFISIKVDREERPDIDQMYMSATQAMTGSGGWPMSVFLFPDGKPFYAGTYFPPQAMYGRPGFTDVLLGIQEAWKNKRSDLQEVASQLVSELEKRSKTSGEGKLDKDILDKAFQGFKGDYNPAYGGFSYAPKFPRPAQLNFLFQYYHRTKNVDAKDMVLRTLQYMNKGGIWDHVGGGFHRYATDPGWRVPHFEKMLYDQAQLANTFLDAYLISGEKQYATVAEQIFEYVLRDMTSPQGGFYSAEDADSIDPYNPAHKSEGAFYLWTEKEIRQVLSKDTVELFIHRFGIKKNGNAPEDPQDEFKGKNILYFEHSILETAQKFKISEESVESKLDKALVTLLGIRSKRNRPHLDDKILVSWNGLMIASLARGSAILGDDHLLDSARKAALFIKEKLYISKNKSLMRRYRDGESGLDGQLDDYAFLVYGLFELYQADQDPEWLKWAVDLTQKQIELFWDKEQGGFFDSVGDTALPFKMKGDYDGAEPAGNSIAAMNLLLLGAVTMNQSWIEKGRICTEVFSASIQAQPKMLPQMLNSWDHAQAKPQQVIISGPRKREDTQKMMSLAYNTFEPGRILLLADNGANEKYLARQLLFIEDMDMIDDKATAYVCKDFVCQLPVNTLNNLKKQLLSKSAETRSN